MTMPTTSQGRKPYLSDGELMKRSPDDGNCAAENFGREVRDAYEAHLTEVLGVVEELRGRSLHSFSCPSSTGPGSCTCGLTELLTKAEALTKNP